MINELFAVVFEGKSRYENSETEKYLVVQEEDSNGDAEWKVLASGWDYNLWYPISERAGLAEAKELTINNDFISIENYITRYKKITNDTRPIIDLFKYFRVEIVLNESDSDFRYHKEEIEHWNFFKEGSTYRKELTTEDESLLISFGSSSYRLTAKEDLIITRELSQPEFETAGEQLNLF